ncbi:MAG: glycosyltransferase family 2 protein [Gemmatimonadota bacterium]
MIYICIPSYNEAPTVGLLLWKIRQVFSQFAREYQLLVANDGSTDATSEVLEPYTKVLPLTVITHQERKGYAASVEALLRLAVERTDRPKRDCAILMHADFAHGAEFIPELVKQIEGGADLVIAESKVEGEPNRFMRWVRRAAPLLLRNSVRIPGVTDVVSGFAAFRLVILKNAIRGQSGPLLTTDGWAANAELFARAAQSARRIETISAIERRDVRPRPTRLEPWEMARKLWRAGPQLKRVSRAVRIPPRPERQPTEMI